MAIAAKFRNTGQVCISPNRFYIQESKKEEFINLFVEKTKKLKIGNGSAPDIAGQSKANPLAMIMSFAMMLKYSFDMQEDSQMIEKAVQNVLLKGLRTADIKDGADKIISTQEMGNAVIEELKIFSGN